jgi:SAM-dependent methyltransferase
MYNHNETVDFFDRYSSSYDADCVDTPYWRLFDNLIFGSWEGVVHRCSSFLDLGCGTGRCLLRMAGKAGNLTGVDISAGMLEILRARVLGRRDITLVQSGADNLPFPSSSFDLAACHGVLQYLDDPGSAIREAFRVLKPGGLYLGVETHSSPLRPLYDKIKWLRGWKDIKKRTFGKKGLERMFLDAGFEPVIRVASFLPPVLIDHLSLNRPAFGEAVFDAAERILPFIPIVSNWGGALIIEAKKPLPQEKGALFKVDLTQ